jgi:Flp pilus assembly protein TadG
MTHRRSINDKAVSVCEGRLRRPRVTLYEVLKAVWTDSSAAVAALYALALFVLVAIAGVAFDYTRLVGMHSELQNAADQAALAGASQLDGDPGTCARAANAAVSLLTNDTILSNADAKTSVTITLEEDCDATGKIRFYQDAEKTDPATDDSEAKFIEVTVDAAEADYAFTPVVGIFTSGEINATAMAGLGSSVCKVPPIMICSPDPSKSFFDPDGPNRIGTGIVATGHSPGAKNAGAAGTGSQTSTWSPGDFGFLQVEDPDASNRNAALLRALAYANPPVDCINVDGNRVSTGNPQGLYDAINTRFDIYDFNNNANGGNVLGACQGGACPPAANVVKDFTNSSASGNNACKIKNGKGGGPGWTMPAAGREFAPTAKAGSTTSTEFDDNGIVDVMGLPRDNCHYETYTGAGFCPEGNGRFGNGLWARADYFKRNHTAGGSTTYPPDWQNISRYNTYLWEIDNGIPNGVSAGGQRGTKLCFSGAAGDETRRILTVAIVTNCSELTGASQEVDIDEWADVFLVEPSIDDPRRHNAFKDAIYLEVIGKSTIAGNGVYDTQNVRRDVPYLVR